jgi:hypothetical protein
MSATLEASQEQVIAFRLKNQNLLQRLPTEALLEAAAACGVQDTPPGSAELSLNARVQNLTPAVVDQALRLDKKLLQVWSARISPYLLPVNDASIFTTGLLPQDEDSWRFCMQSSLPTLVKAGVSATEAMDIIVQAMQEVLDGQILTKGQFSHELNKRVPEKLLYWCKACEAWHVNESQFRLAMWFGSVCFVPTESSQNYFGLTRQWLGRNLPQLEPEEARAELVRRYLHCYGPSTPAHFGQWAGISPGQAHQSWKFIEQELIEVNFDGKKSWLLEKDIPNLEKPEEPDGVRLLPPHDAYLLLRDRPTILPDTLRQKQVWTALGNPGGLLLDSELAGIWRPQKKGKKFLLKVELFHPVSRQTQKLIEKEAELIAAFKGCNSFEVNYNES